MALNKETYQMSNFRASSSKEKLNGNIRKAKGIYFIGS